MSDSLHKISRRYTAVLRDHLDSGSEEALHAAYELGRDAIAAGLGVLDFVKLHTQVALALPRPGPAGTDRNQRAKSVEMFLMEALSPFEVHHRGFREANLRLRELSSKILHTQEEERKRISRELHDEVGQALTAIGINLQLLKQKAAGTNGRFAESITELQSLLSLTMEDIHRFSYELRPVMLDDLGLVVALRWYIKAFARRTEIKVRFTADAAVEKMEDEPKTVIYRVVQEGLTNVFKYAHASRAFISVRKTRHAVCLTVRDNGRGFRPDRINGESRQNGGLGLMGMQERLRLVNGSLIVESAPGSGTTLRATIPFEGTRKNNRSTSRHR